MKPVQHARRLAAPDEVRPLARIVQISRTERWELPAIELAAAAESFEAGLVALAVALTTQLREGREAIQRLRLTAPKAKVLLVEG